MKGLTPLLPSQSPSYSANERILCLSNGHGEDVIAVRILQALQQYPDAPKLAVLPLVGEGRAYEKLGVPLIGPVKSMPSGGFIWMDGWQFARDLRKGLLQLTLEQAQVIRQWAKQGGSVLAVGDIFPLVLACLSGAPYAFVGTAKSEYYLRDSSGRLFPKTWLEGWSGSVYYPWERWLMGHSRCRAIFPRDSLTAKILQKWSIPAFDLGNPMMDGLAPTSLPALPNDPVVASGRKWGESGDGSIALTPSSLGQPCHWFATRTESEYLECLPILLLPGSRSPEAYDNWQQILQAMAGVMAKFGATKLAFLGAIAPGLDLEPLSYGLIAEGWETTNPAANGLATFHQFPDPDARWFTHQNATLVLSQHAYGDCLHRADWAIAMAGTATEQFVGLGKPAIILPGKGPQFTLKFAEAQTRLLGSSVTLVNHPHQVGVAIQTLLQAPETLSQIAENGRQRMGQPGAASRIAQCLIEQLRSE
jgi:hypothetical protein